MRLHFIQHVDFEGPGRILDWAAKNGVVCSRTLMSHGGVLPSVEELDLLVVMGGPMSVYEPENFPWIVDEKALIGQAIEAGKRVLGICLGAQLIADVLGGRVYRGLHREIGWYETKLTEHGKESPLLAGLPDSFNAFHWHGDTFDLPSGCKNLAETTAFSHQAFEYEGRVLGLQFHLECTRSGIEVLMYNCSHEFCEGPYVQRPLDVRKSSDYHSKNSGPLMNTVLQNLTIGYKASHCV